MNESQSARARVDRAGRRNYFILCIVATALLVGMVVASVVLIGE